MAAVMLTLSLVSHAAAAADIQVTAVISDYLHLLAAGAWAGGLLHFAWNAPYFLSQTPEGSRHSVLAAVVPRFSVLASLCVATLILTGLFSSYAQVTVLAALDTPYGRTLLVKLALIVPLLALGAVNLLWLSRKLTAEKRAGEHLGRTVRVEAGLAIVVFLAVGVLVTLEPAHQFASREGSSENNAPTVLTLEDTAEGLTGIFTVDAAEPGEKDVVIELNGRNGTPIENVSDVIMTITYPAEDFTPPVGRPTNASPGRYEFEAVSFSLNGEWQVDVLVVRPDAFDTRLAYSFEVGGEDDTAIVGSDAIAPSPSCSASLPAAIRTSSCPGAEARDPRNAPSASRARPSLW
jgi:copper transport protein